MGDPLGKASARTFNRTSTSIPDTCWSSPPVTFCHTLKMSNESPSEDLKSGLPMSVYAAIGVKLRGGRVGLFFVRQIEGASFSMDVKKDSLLHICILHHFIEIL